jgi:hypothetical protein
VMRWRSLELAAEEAKLENLVREQIRLQTLRAALSADKSKLDASLGAFPDLRGEDLRAFTAYTLRLKRQAEQLHQLQNQCARDLGIQRQKFREAKQRFRLLEELKAKRLTAWRYEEAHELETLASESYLANWNRDLS